MHEFTSTRAKSKHDSRGIPRSYHQLRTRNNIERTEAEDCQKNATEHVYQTLTPPSVRLLDPPAAWWRGRALLSKGTRNRTWMGSCPILCNCASHGTGRALAQPTVQRILSVLLNQETPCCKTLRGPAQPPQATHPRFSVHGQHTRWPHTLTTSLPSRRPGLARKRIDPASTGQAQF